jgi:hypothetical protein
LKDWGCAERKAKEEYWHGRKHARLGVLETSHRKDKWEIRRMWEDEELSTANNLLI